MKSIFHTSLLLILLALITSTSALARGHGGGHWGGGGGGHHHGFGGFYGGFYGPSIGFYSGPGYGYGFGQPYYAPYYNYPPIVTVQPPSPPPVYIERQDQPVARPQPQAAAYWYYCRNPEGYYPYVKQCLGNWQQVSPQPPVR